MKRYQHGHISANGPGDEEFGVIGWLTLLALLATIVGGVFMLRHFFG